MPFRTLRALRAGQPDGLELLPLAHAPLDGFFGALRAAGQRRLPPAGFVLLQAPPELQAADAAATARFAAEAGLADALCVAVPPAHRQAAALVDALASAGLQCARSGLDDQARFADLAVPGCCAAVLDGAFVSAALNDLRAQSVLEAMLQLAGDLGLVAIAGAGVAAGHEATLAELGLAYAAVSGAAAAAPADRSRSGYRDARYAP